MGKSPGQSNQKWGWITTGRLAEENKVAEFGKFHYLKRRGENRSFSRPFGHFAKK
jgi:hypothetical protein